MSFESNKKINFDIFYCGKTIKSFSRKITVFKSTAEIKGSQIKPTERDTYYFSWYAEASKRFEDSKIASQKDSLQKANEKLKAQKVPKTKDYKTDVTPITPIYLPLPEYS